jgi:hypothetical protein
LTAAACNPISTAQGSFPVDGSGTPGAFFNAWGSRQDRTGNRLPPHEEGTAMSNRRYCHRCGAEIPERRLTVLPETRLCLNCSEEIGGDFKTYVIPEHTGKPGSLKRNYGSWKVTRKRRVIMRKEPD